MSLPGEAAVGSAVPDPERRARVLLSLVTEPADPRVARLVADLGATGLAERLRGSEELRGVRTDAGERLLDVDPEGVLRAASRLGARFVVPGDREWPAGLADLDRVPPQGGLGGMPVGLWVRGPLSLADTLADAVAVVGSRSATTYGVDVAGSLAADLAGAGRAVVSGAAYGIDQAAHRGALGGGGVTVAVLACGVDRAYPAAHRGLLEHLATHGLVVSELPPGCAPTRVRFLGRNRLIAALTRGVVVVEAAARSGALNTAHWASRLNRQLMAVPGPVTSAPSVGTHELVRSGAAALVTCGAHVRELLAPAGRDLGERPRGPDRPRDRLTLRQQRVLDATPVRHAAATSSIARAAGLAVGAARAELAVLAEAGLVESVAGAWRLAPEPATEATEAVEAVEVAVEVAAEVAAEGTTRSGASPAPSGEGSTVDG